MVVGEEDDVIMISVEGIIIRMHAGDIATQSRYAGGVRVMRLGENDKVVTVARTPRSEDDENLEGGEDSEIAATEEILE